MNQKLAVSKHLSSIPRANLMNGITPTEQLKRMSEILGIDLWLKRDDLTGLGFGGNKTRQLEFYFGEAIMEEADTILITGAVQSNFIRSTAAAASKLGMKAILQLEERVPNMSDQYYESGNVLLTKILGVEYMSYPDGEDEIGADHALHERAEELRKNGYKPYIINLGINHSPLGAIGYVDCGTEIDQQINDMDMVVVASGSGLTHSGLLTGLRMSGNNVPVYGICVRRKHDEQYIRIATVLKKLGKLINYHNPNLVNEIKISDKTLSPGYGQMNSNVIDALKLMARTEGIFLDPVYTAKTFAGLINLVEQGIISKGDKVVMIHTGGVPAIFGYQNYLV